MARNRIVDFTDGGGGRSFIPWDQAGAQTSSPSLANHSGQAQSDPELMELAALEAAERAYRPLGHGKDQVFTSGYLVDPAPVTKGELVPGAQRGVGQPSLDGYTNPRQAAIQAYLARVMQDTAMNAANRIGGAALTSFIGRK